MIQIESVEDALTAISDARAGGSPLRIAGSGSARPPSDTATVVSTSALDAVVEYRPDDLTIRVQPGMTLDSLEAILAPHNQTAILPETSGTRTVGGVVASGASGYRRLKYGPTRDRVLGVTIATGYGELVTGGGQLVKNVTGYDLPRLVTGSRGALGIITEIILKLWPVPPSAATLDIDDAAEALATTYRPLAVLETESGSFVSIEGSEEAVAGQAESIAHTKRSPLRWPEPINEPVVASVLVPPRNLGQAVSVVSGFGASRWIAQHGVGRIDIGFEALTEERLGDMRRQIAAVGGLVTLSRHPDIGSLDRWGSVPDGLEIQQRLKRLFDPDSVLNPGVLPGGL